MDLAGLLKIARQAAPTMARDLLRAGHQAAVYNRTRARAEPLAQYGATPADSAADAVRAAEAVITMLSDDPAVEETRQSFSDSLAPGALHIGMSTTSVACAKRLAAVPVFGRPEAAAAANLWIVAAGPA